MAALAATSSATPSLQASLIRSRLEAAKRDADQAQAEVDQLRTQVDQAETVYEKRRETVRSLQSSANVPSVSQPTPSDNQAPVSEQSEPTYIAQLSEVFKLAEPILQMDLSSTQKNIVLGSLMSATSALQSASPSSAVAVQRYSSQSTSANSTTMGRVLNITA